MFRRCFLLALPSSQCHRCFASASSTVVADNKEAKSRSSTPKAPRNLQRAIQRSSNRTRKEPDKGPVLNAAQIAQLQAEGEERRMMEHAEARADAERFAGLEKRLDERWAESERRLDEDGSLLGIDAVRDPLNEPDISDMETGEETASKPINKFRRILYTEGELDGSDLSQPPSRQNPHPFDPSTLPPTHSRSLAAYANHLPVLQMLLELGVDLFEIDQMPKIGRALIRLDLEKDVKPKIYWLVQRVGVPVADLGNYLTRNPFFLLQPMDDLKARLEYLQFRRFSRRQIAKMVVESRYWLNTPHAQIDARLGWMQRQFQLAPDELRLVLVKEPRVIQFGVGPIQGLVMLLNQTCCFSHRDLQRILVRDPRVFLMDKPPLLTTYNYLAYVMRVTNNQIVNFPVALRSPLWALRRRHEFLYRLGKANYTPNTPGYINLEQFMHPSDKHFAEVVACTPVADYNRFAKLI